MSLISFLIFATIVGLVLWLFESLPLPNYVKVVVRVLVILAIMIWLLRLAGFSGGPHFYFR